MGSIMLRMDKLLVTTHHVLG